MERIIVERFDSKKQVAERWMLQEFPVTIGRGYGNNVIVSDLYVAKNQLILTQQDGNGWQIDNLEHINEVLVNNVVQQELSFGIQSGDILTIGETRLRILSSVHEVDPTKKFVKEKEYLSNPQRIVITWACVVLTVVCFFVLEFLDTSKATPWIKILASPLAFPLATVPFAWTAFWASMARTLNRPPNIHKHLFVSTIVIIGLRWALIFWGYVTYMVNSMVLGKIFFYLFAGLLLIFLLNTNLKLATTLSRLQRICIANACVWGGVILFEFFMLAQKPEFQNRTNFNSTLKPPYVRILPATSADDFFAETDHLFKKLQKTLEQEKQKETKQG